MTEPKADSAIANKAKEEKKQESTISFEDEAIEVDLLFSVEAMIAKNDQGTAVKILKDMLKTDEKNADLHYRLAIIAKRHWKNFDQARDEFKLALECDPNHSLSLFGLADLYKNQFGDKENAKKCFEELVKVKPYFGVGWKEYGDLLGWRMGDWENAVKAYEESVKYKHRYCWNCYNNCAWGLANKLNDYDKAEEYYKKSLALNNNNITWANFGRLYMDFLKNDTEAERCFRESLKAKETTSGAHVFLGQVLAKRVDDIQSVEQAKKHLIRSLELGDTRGKETLEEIIKREKEKQVKTDIDSKTDDAEDEKEEKKIEFFANEDRVINILERPTEALMASPDNKILCSGDATGKIIFYDMLSLNEEDFNNTIKYDFFCLDRTNCNEVQFSHNGKYLAAGFFDDRQRSSRLIIFNIEEIMMNGLNKESVAKCNKPLFGGAIQFGNKINTNAMQFTPDDEYVMIGLQMTLVIHIPFYQVSMKDGKLSNDIYGKILLKQASLNINKNESVSSLDLVENILVVGTSRGRVFVIDVKLKKLLYQYNHRDATSIVGSVFMTDDMRWIVSSDVYGEMYFSIVRLKSDQNKGGKTKKLKSTVASKIQHSLIYDIERVSHFEDMHFRQISEIQGYNDKLICSASHDGNMALFELISEDIYTGQAMVRTISRVESCHEYLSINTTSWILTEKCGLCLFTGGDDKRIIIHGLTDILLDALPENMIMKKHKHKKKVVFNINDLSASKIGLNEIIQQEKHKLNGWINLWSFGTEVTAVDDDKKVNNTTQDMVGSALGTLQTLTEPVILNLCEDKVKYERVFARMNIDATDVAGLKQINNLIDNVIEKQKCYDYKIKQPNGDLISLLCDGFAANQELHKLAAEIATDPVISGMYEGPVTIKKMKRAVEKSLLKNYQAASDIQFKDLFDKSLDFAFLKDLARAGITCRDLRCIYNCLDKLINYYSKQVEIVRMKNRFIPESELGYRDILLNLRFIKSIDSNGNKIYAYNGHIVELQLHHEKFQNVRKKGKGHANYGATRFLMDFIKITTKKDLEKQDKIKDKVINKYTPQEAIKQNLNELWNVTA